MCGIGGFLASERGLSTRAVRETLRSMATRGPDGYGLALISNNSCEIRFDTEGISTSCQVLLLHRRLSIIDLSTQGAQPMLSADGRLVISFNGEIYNYRELRAELLDCGSVFRSESDTEVLLEGYRVWGRRVFSKLIGMYAFAIYDREQRSLLLARDPFGIKPLYYSRRPGGCFFSSTIRALLTLAEFKPTLHHANALGYLRFGYSDRNGETLLQEVEQLLPGHVLTTSIDNPSSVSIEEFYDRKRPEESDCSFEDATARVRDLFLESVSLHLRSDVPIGFALSGGVDSSAVVCAARQLQGKGADLHSLSFVTKVAPFDEERWIDSVAETTGVYSHKVSPSAEELRNDITELIESQGEPFISTSIYAQRRVFQLAREVGLKVVLDGQGADEVFAGYHHFLGARVASLLKQKRFGDVIGMLWNLKRAKIPTLVMGDLLRAAEHLMPASYQHLFRRLVGKSVQVSWLDYGWVRERGSYNLPYTGSRRRDILHEELERSLNDTIIPRLLRYADRNAMAHSIENRVPFLTPALVRFAASLPEEYLLSSRGESKSIFRAAMRGVVPDLILDRKDKIAFSTPEGAWLKILRPWILEVLSSEVALELPMFSNSELMSFAERVFSGESAQVSQLWRCLNFIEWVRLYQVDCGNRSDSRGRVDSSASTLSDSALRNVSNE